MYVISMDTCAYSWQVVIPSVLSSFKINIFYYVYAAIFLSGIHGGHRIE